MEFFNKIYEAVTRVLSKMRTLYIQFLFSEAEVLNKRMEATDSTFRPTTASFRKLMVLQPDQKDSYIGSLRDTLKDPPYKSVESFFYVVLCMISNYT